MTVYASDPDGDPFTFNLTSRQFSIGSRTGVVTVRASPVPPLDREVNIEYHGFRIMTGLYV